MTTWTAYASLPDTPRGMYDEEIDVQAPNRAQARKAAERIIARDYDPTLRVRRVLRRIPEVTIFQRF